MIGKSRETPFYISDKDAERVLRALAMYAKSVKDDDYEEAQDAIKLCKKIKEQL